MAPGRSRVRQGDGQQTASLIASAKKNAFASYAYFGLTAILTLVFSPVFVAALGASTFGVWKTCLKFLEFATVADGRPTQALKWVIANQEGRGNPVLQRQAVGSALKVWVYFLPLLIGVLVTLTLALPYAIPTADPATLHIVGLVLGANVVLSPLLAIPEATLIGTNRSYQSLSVQTGTLLVSNLLMVMAVKSGYGLKCLAAIVLIATLFNATALLLVVQKTTPWFGILRPKPGQVRSFVGLSVWTFVWSAVEKLLLVSELLLIGVLIGPEKVTSYTFTSYVVQLGAAVCLLIGSAVTPGLGQVLGAGDPATARRVVQRFREVVLFVAVVVAAGALLLNREFVRLWVGEGFYLGSSANGIIALLTIQLVVIRGEAQIHDVGLNIGQRALVGVAATIIATGCAVLLFEFGGKRVEGILCGVFLGRCVLAWAVPQLNDTALETRSCFRRRFFAAAPLLALAYVVGAAVTLPNWTSLLAFCLVGGAGILSWAYLALLPPTSRTFLLSLIPGTKTLQRRSMQV